MNIKITKAQMEQIERTVQEKLREHELSKIPTVECKYGYIFISFNCFDGFIGDTWKRSQKISTLLDLMNIRISMCGLVFGEPFWMSIKGENEKLAEFIRKFIGNGYVLKLDEV